MPPPPMSNRVKNVMSAAGVDTTIFKPHSARSASTSKAADQGFSIKDILESANWSRATTFRTVRNQLLLFIKILSLLCLLREGVVCFSLSCFEHTLLYFLEGFAKRN